MNAERGIYHCAAEDLPQATLPMRMRWAADILDEANQRETGNFALAWTPEQLRDRAVDWDQ